MKAFLYKILLFFCPFLIWAMVEAFLPVTTFTYRHFEALIFATDIPHQNNYYPNINSNITAVGDLCHHTPNAIPKIEVWKTDKNGFRNEEFINQADIVIVGDSFIQGSSLSQDEILSSKIVSQSKKRIKVYNIAPGTMFDLDRLIQTGIIKKPKLIIFSIVERNNPLPLQYYKKSVFKENIKSVFGFSNMNVYLDKAFKTYSIDFLKARIEKKTGEGIAGKQNPKMYFLSVTPKYHAEKDLESNANILLSYKKYCDDLGVKFLFLPMPDKETVYYDFIPLPAQPDYLSKLDIHLQKYGIETINTLRVYNDYRKSHESLLYHLDDTHWNETATDLIAAEILKRGIESSINNNQ